MSHRNGVQTTIEVLAAKQLGVFAREQALSLGATARMIERRVVAGTWPVVHRGVYRVAAVPRTREQSAMAACLWVGSDGLISHATAGQLWGLEGVATDEVHLTLAIDRRMRSGQVIVHRVSNLGPADYGRCGPIAVTSPLRTAIDLAAVLDSPSLEVAIESALRRRLFSVRQLRWRADALMGTGRPGSSALRALIDSRELGRSGSGWEVRLAQALEGAGIGTPTRQHPIRAAGKLIATVDLAYPDARIAIEYDSDQWHHGVARRHRDAERRNQLRGLGWTVVEVTSSQLRDRSRLVATVRSLLAA